MFSDSSGTCFKKKMTPGTVEFQVHADVLSVNRTSARGPQSESTTRTQ
jgi:hypothetical protein